MKETIFNYLKGQLGDDDPNLLETLYTEYRNTVFERIRDIQNALEAKDFKRLHAVSHTLKGDALMVGDHDMNRCALQFEISAKSDDEAGCRSHLTTILECAKRLP